MTKTKDEVLQEIFDNDPIGILDDKIETKEMPYDFWNHGINPIVGYKLPKINEKGRKRDKWEYPEEHDYIPED